METQLRPWLLTTFEQERFLCIHRPLHLLNIEVPRLMLRLLCHIVQPPVLCCIESETTRVLLTITGNALIKCGETEKQIGGAERELIQSAAINFLTPFRNFLEGDFKTILVSVTAGSISLFTELSTFILNQPLKL